MQTSGGTAEVKLFGDGDEVAEMAQLDIAIHNEDATTFIYILLIIIRTNKILDI